MVQKHLLDLILVSNNIVGLFVTIHFLNHLLVKRAIKPTRKKLWLVLLLVIITGINIFFRGLALNLLFGLGIYFLIGHSFYQGEKHIKLIVAIFILVFSLITELITALIFGLLFDAHIGEVRDNVMHLFLGGIVSKLFLIMLIELIIRFWKRKASKVKMSSWMLVVSLPLISIILVMISVYDAVINNKFSNIGVIICFSVLYINLITFYLFDHIIVQLDENNKSKIREQQLLIQQDQYETIISGYNQVRKVHHDMLGHLIILDKYIGNDMVEEAKTYIHKLHEELDFPKQGIFSKNVAIDAIINNKKARAKELGVICQEDIMISQNLNIEDIDLCIILGNALNNAIEACRRNEIVNNEKRIELTIRYKRNCLFIEVKNTYDINTIKMKDGKFISSKVYRKKEEVGIGLANIRNVTEKYGGIYETDLRNEMFVLKVMLPDRNL